MNPERVVSGPVDGLPGELRRALEVHRLMSKWTRQSEELRRECVKFVLTGARPDVRARRAQMVLTLLR